MKHTVQDAQYPAPPLASAERLTRCKRTFQCVSAYDKDLGSSVWLACIHCISKSDSKLYLGCTVVTFVVTFVTGREKVHTCSPRRTRVEFAQLLRLPPTV